ncbi:MAG TPA: PDZ domain-containing protein, partial [Candidatus Melainabacteria bacterium]|nr:PDZ domain-containing protein [Candidatus Melainabacteria bacterium]
TVANVVPGGPADISGLRRGDIILKVNGTVVNSSDEVRAFIKTSNPGDILVMSLQRGLNVIEKKVKLGLYPSNM